jgi:hypothetical protein
MHISPSDVFEDITQHNFIDFSKAVQALLYAEYLIFII